MMSCIIPGNVQNVVTEMRYGPGGQLVELIAKNPVTGDQVTRYEYGTTLADSAVVSNRLLRAEVYPDAADSSDRVKYSYNRQGQRTRMQDQNGSVHEYEHDLLGRQTADKVTALGDGVDGAVRRIGMTYEVRGMVEKVTSYSDAAGTTPVNEVQNVYNSFGQLKEQYQEHSGSVNTGTTPKVQYAYADGSANTTRPTSVTYPNGRVLDYLYDDMHADKLSRIRTLRFDGTDVCRYAYLGLNTFVTTDYLQPQVKLDYALGSGVNPYAGFDRFGRIIDLLWTKYGASSSSSSSSGGAGNDLVRLKYGYDRASNRTFREDLVAQAYGKNFDELYEYDGLHRLKKFHRGRLTDDNRTITSPTLQQGWQLDATGNWRNFTQNDQVDPDQTLDQQRLANRVNEITQIARTVGPQWATPEYDRNGNMTVIPQPKEMTQTFQGTWDAWNRLVKLTEPNGSGGWQTLAEYQYDGQTWRIIRKDYEEGLLRETRHLYYTSRWQDIEERLDSDTDPNQQYVWGLRYIDDLSLRDRDSDDDGTIDERLYALQDANWNIVYIAQSSGNETKRCVYDPYGNVEIFSEIWTPLSVESLTESASLFTSRELVRVTGLYDFRKRSYHAQLGLFISHDTQQYIDGMNLYRAHFAPNWLDPFGDEKWEGPETKIGNRFFKTTVYYGPWKCRAAEIKTCKAKCKKRKFAFKGCIWLADVKIVTKATSALSVYVEAGTRIGFYNCCCDCPTLKPEDTKKQRSIWDNFREKFREKVASNWGEFPTDASGKPFPVHHVHDLWHGGDPVDPANLLPIPPEPHKEVNKAYPDCYAGLGGWDTAGPDRPYKD